MEVYIPSYLVDDFQKVLSSSLADNYTVNFNSQNVIRGLLVQKSSAVNNQGFDNIRVLRTSLYDNINKGDYLEDSTFVYLVMVTPFEKSINSLKSEIQICNGIIDFKRFKDVVYDNAGNIIGNAGYVDVVTEVYGVCDIEGSYSFDAFNGSIGIVPSNVLRVKMQYNMSTQNIMENDVFYFHNLLYKVVNIDYSQLNPKVETGLLFLYAEKVLE